MKLIINKEFIDRLGVMGRRRMGYLEGLVKCALGPAYPSQGITSVSLAAMSGRNRSASYKIIRHWVKDGVLIEVDEKYFLANSFVSDSAKVDKPRKQLLLSEMIIETKESFPAHDRFAKYMWNKLSQSFPNHKNIKNATLESWGNVIRLMHDRDSRDYNEAKALFDWGAEHEFWKANLQSPGALRDHYDKMKAQKVRDDTKQDQTPKIKPKSYTNLENYGK